MSTVDGNRPCRDGSATYETSHDVDGEAALSETIIFAVASAKGVDPIECDLELYDAVDLEALDALFEHHSPDDHWRFEFSVDEYLVFVEGNGDVTVCER